MRSTSLPVKLIRAFLLVAIPAVSVITAISLYVLLELDRANHELEEITASLGATRRLETAVARTLTPISAYLVDRSPEQEQRFAAFLGEAETRLANCSNASCHGLPQQPQAMAQMLVPHLQRIREHAAFVFSEDPLAEQDKFRAVYEISKESEQASAHLARMSSMLLSRVAPLRKKTVQMHYQGTALILVSAALILALAAMMAYLLSRRLLKHLNELLAGTRHILQGDLRYRVAVKADDEVGQLARSFNAMVQEIEEHRADLERRVEAKTAQLKQAQDSLIQSEKLASIGLLASGVAHELNNPLTSILMNVNLLMEDASGQPALQRELQRICDDTARCKRIIDDLRDFSRRYDLDLVPTDLNRLVGSALDAVGHRLQRPQIALVPQLAQELPPVPCDPARMEEVLVNILVNALEAMPEDGRLTVTTALAHASVRVSIQDTGPGIAPGIRGKVFDPFFTTKTNGTGLGLSIVYRIMEAHGGKVTLESGFTENGPLVGTRVILSLPLEASGLDHRVASLQAASSS